jgi:low temperature requirement protein LtrA
MENILEGRIIGFALAFAFLRSILVLQYWNVYRHIDIARPLARLYGSAYGISVIIWIFSIFLPHPWYIVAWVGAVLLDLSMPWIAMPIHSSAPTDPQHVPERFGLFTLIVLGELMVSVGLGLSDASWTRQETFIAAAGFAVGACLWSLYFDDINTHKMKTKPLNMVSFAYAHLVMLVGMVFIAGGINLLIHHDTADHSPMGLWALCGGLIAFLIALIAADTQIIDGLHRSLVRARLFTILTLAFLIIFQPAPLPGIILTFGVLLLLVLYETTQRKAVEE